MDDSPGKIRWPHAPPHFLVGAGTFMVTASTYGKVHHFGSRKRLRHLTEKLLEIADENGWKLEAWAVLANHYHWIGKSPAGGAESLGQWIGTLHRKTARFVNGLDGVPGRNVLQNSNPPKPPPNTTILFLFLPLIWVDHNATLF